jgi:DNA-dependent RNA polymerase auxiliary subunit epsilon
MDIFGYSIKRKEPAQTEKSFVPPSDEGALDTVRAGGYYGTYLDLETAAKNESEQIKRYRDISVMSDVDMAIEDIVNEAIANLDNEDPVKIDLQKLKTSSTIKKAIEEEFNTILVMMKFKRKAQDFFRRWYIDGRMYFHKVIDTAKPKQGLTDIRYIDPRKIKKVRNVIKEKDPRTGVEFIKKVEEFFVYHDKGMYSQQNNGSPTTQVQGLKITPDAISYVTSGLFDVDHQMVLSYLHKAIKPANQLRMMENALVIYRLARAPERRIFYIDVGNLPKLKAEQYLKDIMNRYRNKMVYDANTGELRDDKKVMSLLEDFWLPRREGGKGTEIDTLPGGQNLGEIADIEYFQGKLYEALNVPASRLQQGSGLNFGRAAEITRDELKFTKFIAKLRRQFTLLFSDLLKTQLMLKGIVTDEDWEEMKEQIEFVFTQDAYYTESKDQEILRARLELLNQTDPFVGKYVTKKYVQKNILRLTENEIKEMDDEMEDDASRSMDYSDPLEDPNQPDNILPKGSPFPAPEKEEAPSKPKPKGK